MKASLLLLASFLLLLPTRGSGQTSRPEEAAPWKAPQLERAVAVRDGRTGALLSWDEFLRKCAEVDAVFLGETHVDETTHRVELGVFEGLAKLRKNKVVLAMEMFERDAQPHLDAYLAGEMPEAEFRRKARAWSNYETAYRPMIELAKAEKLAVIASNFPRPLARRLAMMGDEASLDSLPEKIRGFAPKTLHPNTKAYWRRVDNAVRGHIGMMGNRDGDRLFSMQSLWDNAMGEACAVALDAHEGCSVVHVNGGFHSAYWDGTVRQFKLRKPDARVVTVDIVTSSHPAVQDPEGAPRADFVVYAEARARDINEGSYAVHVDRELEYRLHLPRTRSEDAKFPLLIWLSDDGFTAREGMNLWRARLGDDAIIAVVEAPYRETRGDLVEGGRWFWPDSFNEDLSAMSTAVERIWAYLLRHYPIDPERVCLAAEGTGATVISVVSLGTDRMAHRAVAFQPRRYVKIKDIPLPLPELRGKKAPPKKSLRLFLADKDRKWWTSEIDEYKGVGFDSSIVGEESDAWLVARQREDAIREALGLQTVASDPKAPRRHIIANGPRARLWARILASRAHRDDETLVAVLDRAPEGDGSQLIATAMTPDRVRKRRLIPRCPGPFGGTTVLVLPENTSEEEVAAWMELEEKDPLARFSRFHRLRIATQKDGPRELGALLETLLSQGRKNVLIVPALFCGDEELMRTLSRRTRAVEDRMTLRWRPGLGG